MDASESIARLHELLQIAESGKLGKLGAWLVPCLRDYFENAKHGVTLDRAFDVAITPGKSPW